MRLIDFLDRAATLHPDNEFLRQDATVRTYREAQAATHRIAAALQRDGLTPDEPVGFYMPNDWRGVEALYGVFRAGNPIAPVNARNTAAANAGFLRDAGARALFFHSAFAAEAARAAAECPGLRLLVCLDGECDGHPALADWMAPEGTHAAEVAVGPEDAWGLFGTSGTTGKSKCVVQTQLTALALTWDMLFAMRVHEPVRHLVVGPVSHFAGSFLFALSAVGSTHTIHAAVDAGAILETIERERIQVLFLPPTAIYALLDHPDVHERDLSSLEILAYAGAPMARARLEQAIAVFGPVMMNMYGQTEANGPIAFLRPEEHRPDGDETWRWRLGSIGRASITRQLAIMDDDGNLLGPGEPGELVMRSWANTPGYLDNPEANAELKKHGWLHTGDVGIRDADGYIVLVDRKKDMIVSGGFNVFSAEVEQVLETHPAVTGAAVVGVPDDKWGEAVKAIVELRAGADATADELIALCKEALGSVKAPKSVDFMDALPRNPNGKVRKKELREAYWAGHDRRI